MSSEDDTSFLKIGNCLVIEHFVRFGPFTSLFPGLRFFEDARGVSETAEVVIPREMKLHSEREWADVQCGCIYALFRIYILTCMVILRPRLEAVEYIKLPELQPEVSVYADPLRDCHTVRMTYNPAVGAALNQLQTSKSTPKP
jgi:hypothetical protein